MKLAKLRKLMAEQGVKAYFIPKNDAHMGENIPQSQNR